MSQHLQPLSLPSIDGAPGELYDPDFPQIDNAPIQPMDIGENPPQRIRFELFVNLGGGDEGGVKFRSYDLDGRKHFISVDAFNAIFLKRNEENPSLSYDQKRTNAAHFRKAKLMPKSSSPSSSSIVKVHPCARRGGRKLYFIEVSKLRDVIRKNPKHYPSRFAENPESILKTETIQLTRHSKEEYKHHHHS